MRVNEHEETQEKKTKSQIARIMITGEIKNKIDQIWDTFFVDGVTNPITVQENHF